MEKDLAHGYNKFEENKIFMGKAEKAAPTPLKEKGTLKAQNLSNWALPGFLILCCTLQPNLNAKEKRVFISLLLGYLKC